ncbi:MAG: 50S ribosomal protein L18 [Patescibacteria group bacterium]
MSDINAQQKTAARIVRHRRVRAKVSGTAERPRLTVFRSNKFISGQVIDDTVGKTLAAVTEKELDSKARAKLVQGEDDRKGKVSVAYALGKMLAEKAKAAGVKAVVFDRGGFAYKGRIASFAAGARDNGLEF